jgi:small conductance mechanosensitive channel
VPAITVLLILLIAYLMAGWAGRATSAGLRKSHMDETLARFFGKMIRWIILIFAVIMCLGRFGVETASFAALVAAAGLAVGLAFQGTLSNFSSGVMLLIFRPFKVGDVVNVAGELGKVEEIELFTTNLDTFDNRRIILPNSAIFGAKIENITHHPKRRVDVPLGVSYSADIDKTRDVLTKAAEKMTARDANEPVQAFLSGLGSSSVDWVVRVWCAGADYWDVKQALIRQVKADLDAAGLSIPFPQMDVHFVTPPTFAVPPTQPPLRASS